MLRGRRLLAVVLSFIGAAAITLAAESGAPDKPAPAPVANTGVSKSAAEVPVPVTGSHLPDIVMPDEIKPVELPSKKSAVQSDTAKDAPAPTNDGGNTPTDALSEKRANDANNPVTTTPNPVAPTPNKGADAKPDAAPGAAVATPAPAAAPDDDKDKKAAADKAAPDKAAPDKAAADKTDAAKPAATTEGTVVMKSNRGDCEADDLESMYAPPTIEGFSGWKKNKVHYNEVQLIDCDMIGIPDRWRIGIPKDSRHVKGDMWNPYRQNMIKGDYPIMGQSIFLNATFTSDSLFEGHTNPTPAGVSTQRPGEFKFFGNPSAVLIQQNFEMSLQLFKGETDFKPHDWEVTITPVFNINDANLHENFAVNIDPRKGDERFDSHLAFQEFFGEYHFADLSPNYDLIADRAGIQFFNENFRGFLFADNNLGNRTFGNLESNRIQYNLAAFDMLSKDTNSDLNNFSVKKQYVLLGNVIRQDTFVKGFNVIGNVAMDLEDKTKLYNSNGVIVEPAPIGDLAEHQNKVYYVGLGSDGHVGRFNITEQFYHAMGTVSHDPLAGKRLTVDANMFAFEGSYDLDWMRFKASYFYASGDHNTFDHKATGFDSIMDDPNFAGGEFSFWVRQGNFGAGNALTALKNRDSLLPSLNTSKGEGQRNFTNPGLDLYNLGYEANITQNVKAVVNLNYLQFDNTSSLEVLLHQNNISRNIGWDYSMGINYRPFLNNQVIINGGVSALTPSQGFVDLYSRRTLYAAFLGLTVRY